jgi:small-conductance mechanosensitive channel
MTSTIEAAPQLLAATVFLFVVWGVRKAVLFAFKKGANKSHLRPSLVRAFTTIIGVAIWIVGILIAATIAMPGLTAAKLIAGLGVGSIAIGLAFKDTFENFLAGILILLRKPMQIDDHIECEDVDGQVKEITIRDTYIRRRDGTLVMVPNGYLYKNPLRVLTDWDERRFSIVCGVAYDEDIGKAREVIRKAVESVDGLSKKKGVDVFAENFGSSSIDFLIRWWSDSIPRDGREMTDKVVEAVKRDLDKAGIEIPFPYRTMTFKEPLSIAKSEN